jgi:hypothetical protein
MSWSVDFHPRVQGRIRTVRGRCRTNCAALAPLREFGPDLGRPDVDTLKDSRYANMKELRFKADGGVWRVAFAFDPRRNAILLVAGDKSGVSEPKFYKRLIDKADKRYKEHLDILESKE